MKRISLLQFLHLIICLNCNDIKISRISPRSGPTTGGTIISVWGTGFTGGEDGTECYWRGMGDNFGKSSDLTANVNSTFIMCRLPKVSDIENFILISADRLNIDIDFYISRNSSLSNQFSFTFFNLSKVSITGLTPQEGVFSQVNSVHFTVINLNYTQELACLLAETSYPATTVSANLVKCDLPAVRSSRRELVSLSLNGDQTGGISPSPGTTTEFTFYKSAPIVLITYAPSLTRLHLDFDRQVEIGGREEFNTSALPECSLLFTTDSLAKVGTDARCSWGNYQQGRLVIELTGRSSLNGVSNLVLSSQQPIRSRYVLYSYLLPDTSPIAGASTLPIPVLHTYTHIPSCGDLTFDALSSQLGGTHALTVSWGVAVSNNRVSSLDTIFASELSLQWSLDSSLFESGVTYSVSLTLTNFLQNTVTETVSLIKSDEHLPPATVYHSLAGVMYTHSQYTIISGVELRPCLPAPPSPLNFSWSISNLITPLSGTDAPILIIPPHSLNPSTQHRAQYSLSNGSLSRHYQFDVSVESASPLALILGGSKRTHYLGEDLVIDASASHDPSLLRLTYSWNCTDVITNRACKDKNGDTLMSRNDLPSYNFPRNLLVPSLLLFSLRVWTEDSRTSDLAQITVDIGSSTPDLIYIRPFPYSRLPIDPQLPLAVSGWVRTRRQQAQLAVTTVRDVVANGVYYDCASNLSASPLLFSSQSSYRLPPDSALLTTSRAQEFTLRVPPLAAGQWYRLAAALTVDSNTTATAEVDIEMATLPHFGTLTVSSYILNGVRIYSMLASGWRDSPRALPLKYRFGISYNHSVHWLTPATTLARIDTPLLCSVNSHLPLLLEVENSHGSKVQYNSQVAVTAHDDVIGAVEKVKLNLLYGYNVMSGLSTVSSILYYYKTEVMVIPSHISDTLWSHFSSAFYSVLPREFSFSAHAISLVADLITRAQFITVQQVGEMLTILDQALESVNSCPPVDKPFLRGISTQLLDSVIIAVARLNTSRVDIWHKLPLLLARLAYATRNGFHADIVSISSGDISLKVSHTTPNSLHYAACNARESDCSNTYPRFMFSQSTFDAYNEWNCSWSSCIRNSSFDTVNCSGVIIVTSTLPRDSYYLPTQYSTQVLSSLASISLFHPSNFQELTVGDISLSLSLQTLLYSPQFYSCALWDKNNLTWDTSVCSTLSISSSTISCQCQTPGTIAIVSTCPPGLYGSTCAHVCPRGQWGDKCTQSCTCSPQSSCLARNGSCDCHPGYTGTSCDRICAPWSYGKDCLSSCTCVRGRSTGCDHVNGTCDCETGFRGETCAITCSRDTWGYKCANLCACKSTAVCNYLDGSCNCFDGFGGVDCGTSCPAWTFGSNCTGQCTCDRDSTASCRATDGFCLCNETYMGANCSVLILVEVDDSFPIVPIAAGSIPLVLLILVVPLIIVGILFCYRKKRKMRVAISPDKVPLYLRTESGPASDRFRPQSPTTVNYNGFVSTKVDSYVAILLKSSGTTVEEEEDCWYFIEVVVPEDRECWGAPSRGHGEEPFQAPERPEIGVLSLSVRCSENSKYDSTFEGFPEPVLLPRGDYTLFDLRSEFVESGQWPGGPFQFLKKDVAFTFIPLVNEDDFALAEFPDTNIYIQRVRDSDSCMLELCVCGKLSEFECSHCGSRGYCGEDCQTLDWEIHLPMCLKAQNAFQDPNTSLDATMAGSLELSAFEGSVSTPERKLGVSAKLEKIGENEFEEAAVSRPPIPVHAHMREQSALPEREELPITESDQEILDVHPDTDEVVLFDPHEDKRHHHFQTERKGSLPGSVPEL